MLATLVKPPESAGRSDPEKKFSSSGGRLPNNPAGDPFLFAVCLLRCVSMSIRSVVTSAPAVAGFALLALVIGVIFGVRSAMDNGDDGDTGVAGVVIERSEVPTLAPLDPAPQPRIVRPAEEETEPPAAVTAEPDIVVVGDPVAEEPVGLIREPSPVVILEPEPDTTPPRDTDGRSAPDNDGDPPGQPDPTTSPRPDPSPTPKPDPRPQPTPEPTENPATYALSCPHDSPDSCEGVSRDTAESYEYEPGQFEWLFRTIAGHDNQTPEAKGSRQVMSRLSVGFSEATWESQDQVREFRCDAVLTAGSRRLTTDTEHVFEISLWTSDGYDPLEVVDGSTVIIREAFDLAAGTSATLLSNSYELDAADGGAYTCKVVYRSL